MIDDTQQQTRPKRNSEVFVGFEQDEWKDFTSSQKNAQSNQNAQQLPPVSEEMDVGSIIQEESESPKNHRMGLSIDYTPAQIKQFEALQALQAEQATPTISTEKLPKVQQSTPAQSIPAQAIKSPLRVSPTKQKKYRNPGQELLHQMLKKHWLTLQQELEGEVFVNISQPQLYCQNRVVKGKLLITNYRFAFYSEGFKKKLDIALGYVERVSLRPQKKSGAIIQLYLKYSPIWKFKFDRKQDGELVDSLLNLYCFPLRLQQAFAFSHYKYSCMPEGQGTQNQRPLPANCSAWSCDLEKQYQRIGLAKTSKIRCAQNQRLRICDTYPAKIVIQQYGMYRIQLQTMFTNDDLLKWVSKNRQRERIPVATYLHKCGGMSYILYRGSQIRAGVDKLLTDVQYINYLSYESKLIIIETRSRINVKVVQLPEYYRNVELEFLGIQPPNTAKGAYFKIVEACLSSDSDKFVKNVVESKWYQQVRSLLMAADKIAKLLDSKRNVFVHCSDGWDRTSQICALTQLILDPYYRTFEGFPVLVEKEFISFGEPFHLRLGNKGRSEQQIPIFVQFLDCVSQLVTQFPLSFEFTNKYLAYLSHLLYTNRFGTFLGSCELQLKAQGVRQSTLSIWPEIKSKMLSANPFYLNFNQTGVIELNGLNTSYQALRFWRENFFTLTNSVKDAYKLSPYAEQTQDYVGLAHFKLKGETEKLKKIVAEQMKTIKQYQKELEELESEEYLTMAVVAQIVEQQPPNMPPL